MHTMFMPGALRGQKKEVDSLEMELWMALSHRVGAEKQTGPLQGQQTSLTTELLLQSMRSFPEL